MDESGSTRLRVAVIGAGVAGLTAARALSEAGRFVHVFDKGRGPGGRLATRRADPYAFDHGAQYFTVRDARLGALIGELGSEIQIAPWNGRFGRLSAGVFTPQAPHDTRWVAIPGMSGLARRLAKDLEVTLATRISGLAREGAGWRLTDETGAERGWFDQVVVATPPDQAIPLLDGAPDLARRAASAVMDPCWAALLGFAAPLDLPFDGAKVADSPLAWIARNESKPGRKPAESLVLHASAAWSRAHLELTPEAALPLLTAALAQALGRDVGAPAYAVAHRWRYAQVAVAASAGPSFDPASGIGICGDWTIGARVESAWLSGTELTERMLAG